MPYLKLTNVNYYHGGGKTPHRLRHNQNYRLWEIDANEVSKWLDDGLLITFTELPRVE